jgi:hypothetical protein
MNEIDWLIEQRPDVAPPDEAATARARHLLATAVHDEQGAAAEPVATPVAANPAAVLPGALTARERRRGRSRAAVGLALAGVAAVGVAVVGLPLGGGAGTGAGGTTSAPVVRALAPGDAEAKPLVRLSAHVAELPTLPGDATWAKHTNVMRDGRTFSGIDLYLDDGTYYYGATDDELRAAEADRASVDYPVGAMMRAAAAAQSMPSEQARRTFLDASDFPGAPTAAERARGRRVIEQKIEALPAAQRAAVQRRIDSEPPQTETQHEDNYIWTEGLDVLEAGGARSDVRSGVLRLFSTLAGVVVDETTLGGRKAIRLRQRDFPDHYVETVYLDADSGVMLRMTGGTAGQDPDVVVTYEIRRVTASDLLQG